MSFHCHNPRHGCVGPGKQCVAGHGRARTSAWLGRGIRPPGRKALLAAAVSPDAYGRAFGFERMMDTLGAIVAPITALWLQLTSHNYHRILAWTLVPGVLAALTFALLVREAPNHRAAAVSFWAGVRQLPRSFRKFLLAVGIFGLGDFSHTLLILFATQELTPAHGRAAAASIAVGLSSGTARHGVRNALRR